MIETPTEPARRAAELAPSEVRADQPTVARLVGMFGLGLAVLGTAAVIANQYGPRWIGTGTGYLIAAAGLAAMLYHAARDPDREYRRLYGAFALMLIAAAVIAAFIPGPLFGEGVAKATGYHFLPWTPVFGLVGLAYLVAPLRHETEDRYRNLALSLTLGIGGLLCVGSVVFGIARPDTLVGPGVLMALLGLGYLAAFLSQVDTSDGPGYVIAVLLGVVGGGAAAYALGRAAFPTVLFEGPAALKTPYQTYDKWKVAARAVIVLVCLAVAAWGLRKRGLPGWLRAAVAAVGLGFAAVFVVGSFATPVSAAPPPYLVPSGLLLLGIGLVYLAVSLGAVSDNPFVTLTRRELAAYFFSPIAYIVLFGMAIVAGVGYGIFLNSLFAGGAVMEPILQNYWGATLGAAFGVLFLVPAITMRSLSEEKRTGTLEVLLTAPVSETAIVLSKFAAAWLFYMLTWLPLGLYLIGLRTEGGQPFDYRPLLSYYLALGVCGAGFIAMGLFFSGLTRNQIVAAVLTFAGLFFLLLTIILQRFEKVGPGLQGLFNKLDFYSLWLTALGGQLPVTNVLVYLSLAVFWLFLTVKVLEARKWA